MSIDIKYLEQKIKLFSEQNQKLTTEINSNIALSKKLEGAIEAMQILINELKQDGLNNNTSN